LGSSPNGVQSGSEEVLNGYNRPVEQEKAIEAARTIVECGVEGFFDLITRVHFEEERHCRETFDFLLDFPLEMKTVGFGHMTMFPGYGYTQKVVDGKHAVSVSD